MQVCLNICPRTDGLVDLVKYVESEGLFIHAVTLPVGQPIVGQDLVDQLLRLARGECLGDGLDPDLALGGDAEQDPEVVLLQPRHRADVVHLHVVGQRAETLPPHLHNEGAVESRPVLVLAFIPHTMHTYLRRGRVLADDVGCPDVDHVQPAADDEGLGRHVDNVTPCHRQHAYFNI